jgi:hypothetical protein
MRPKPIPASTRKPITALLWPLGFGSALFAGLLLLSRCFSPDLPACAYICNADEPRCPDEYECRPDGYCHLRGSSEACPYTMDLSPAPPRPDLAQAGDMTAPDMAAPDMTGSPDL